MKLYNCITRAEKDLKEIELQGLGITALADLAKTIKRGYNNCILEDESIVIEALYQIIEALETRAKRFEGEKEELIRAYESGRIDF